MKLRLSIIAALSMGLFYASCKTSEEPTSDDYDDIAAGVAAIVAGDQGSDTESMQDAVLLSDGETPEGLSTANLQGSSAGTRGSLNYSYEVHCTDFQGNLLDICDAEITDFAEISVNWDGNINTERYDATVSRDGNWTLSNLQGDTVLFNGEGSFYLESSFTGLFLQTTRTFIFDYLATYENVSYERSSGLFVDGTATFDIRAERTRSNAFSDVEAEFNVMAVITFQSDGNASIVLDGKRSYQLNTATATLTLATE
ncbi:MAG: hypothetical protein IPJ88_07440 [Myxococcales bacterium]|nr:MAG: hypothetical protein IPJ88_07440 [Myxococcales bacterium]